MREDDVVDAAAQAEKILLRRCHVVVNGSVAEGRFLFIQLIQLMKLINVEGEGEGGGLTFDLQKLTTDGDSWLWWHSPALQPNLKSSINHIKLIESS